MTTGIYLDNYFVTMVIPAAAKKLSYCNQERAQCKVQLSTNCDSNRETDKCSTFGTDNIFDETKIQTLGILMAFTVNIH